MKNNIKGHICDYSSVPASQHIPIDDLWNLQFERMWFSISVYFLNFGVNPDIDDEKEKNQRSCLEEWATQG